MTDAQNGNTGVNNGPSRDGRDGATKPDPSERTLESLEREILHLRELIEARLENMEKTSIATQLSNQKALDAATVASTTAINAAQAASTTAINAAQLASDKAVSAALAASDKAILELDGSIARRISAVEQLTDSKFVTYGNLLESQKQQVNLSLGSSERAVTKAEQFNNQQFKTMSDKIDDLKQYQFSTVGKGAGMSALYGWIVAGVGLLATIIVLANAIFSN